MPRAKQSAGKDTSTKASKKAEIKRKEEKVPWDEDVASLPSENEGELGESSARLRRVIIRKSRRVPEESKGSQMKIDDVELEGPAEVASHTS